MCKNLITNNNKKISSDQRLYLVKRVNVLTTVVIGNQEIKKTMVISDSERLSRMG
jgi:hypothetical protein